MTSISFALKAEQSMAVSWVKEIAFYQTSEEYVTGSALRGALAAAWLADHGKSPLFAEIFEGPVSFLPAMPRTFRIAPLSMRRCKYRVTDDCDQWFDDHAQASVDDRPPKNTCDRCNGPTEYSKGRMEGPYDDVSTDLRSRRVRTAISPETGSSRQRALFAQQALSSDLAFEGRICHLEKLSDQARQEFTTWVAGMQESGRGLRLGRGKSVMGKATITDVKKSDDKPIAVSPGWHVLRCISPMILLDDAGRATTDITYELRRRGLANPTVVREWLRPTMIGGWHTISGLPKPVDHALIAGSTYLIDVCEEDADAWSKVVVDGLGHRRREGFGVVELDPDVWEQPPKRSKPPLSQAEIAYKDMKEAIDKLLGALTAEEEGTISRASCVSQIHDLLRVLDQRSPNIEESLKELNERPFWRHCTRKAIEAREALLEQVMCDKVPARRSKARQMLNYLATEWLGPEGGDQT